MSDIRTTYIDLLEGADLSLDPLGLVGDDGLTTAVILSLFSDARADADDPLPDHETDPRGWWGDVEPLIGGYALGSKLWLLAREKQTAETLTRARSYAETALAWMIGDGVAAMVQVVATAPRRGVLWLAVTIDRPGADMRRWELTWAAMAEET